LKSLLLESKLADSLCNCWIAFSIVNLWTRFSCFITEREREREREMFLLVDEPFNFMYL
jgi:hypothetical protein